VSDSSAILARYLAAWRVESLQAPRTLAREQARAAMLASNTPGNPRRGRALSFLFTLRWRGRRQVLIASTALLGAAVAVGLFGWNAPAGSALYSVRVARQSVQLWLPGADLALLHLQFAEDNLDNARRGVNVSASLAAAGSELDAARHQLPPAAQAASLWERYDVDEATLVAQEQELESEQRAEQARPSAGTPASGGSTDDAGRSGTGLSTSPSQRPRGTETPENTPWPQRSGGESPDPSEGRADRSR
jgi:hypothetical protein